MSNAGQVALGIVGGIIGFVVGGPTGAAYGLQIGLAVGTLVSPTQLPGTFGPRLQDRKTTTAQLGDPIAEVFGTDVVSGTVIWLGDVVEHAKTEELGGKGGPEQENTTYTYTQSIAIGLCRGPKEGLLRIWENGELVYDARPQLDDESDSAYEQRTDAAARYAEGFELYLGDEDQLPDPTIELKEGAGNVPAYRGLMYIVYADRELKSDQGQRHPTFKFEVASVYVPIPDLRQIEAETLQSSFILHAGQSAFTGDLTGYSNVPFFVFGSVESAEILGGPAVVQIVGGYSANIRQCIFGGVAFPPKSFLLTLDDYFYRLITKVEFQGPGFLGPFTVFDAPTSNNTGFTSNGKNTFFEQGPTTETAFADAQDYLVRVTSTRPAGRLSFCDITAANVSPLGAPVIGFNSSAYSSALGGFGSGSGTVAVDIATEVTLLGLYVETASTGKLKLVLDGAHSALKLVVTFTGDNGAEIYGPALPMVSGGVSIYTWDTDEDVFSAPNGYEITILSVGVAPELPGPNAPVTIGQIVATICERCGLAGLIDVEDLYDVTVHGFKVDRVTDGRSAISTLRQIGFFDAVESNVIKFVRRGKAPARTLEAIELGAHEYGTDPPPAITTKTKQDVELPRQLFVQYRDPARDYEDGQQASPTRLITDAVNDKYVDVSVAIDGTQALRAAEILWADEWAGRWEHSCALDAAHADLEPTDVILLPVDGRLERMRIVSFEDSAVVLRAAQLVRDDDGSYVSAAIAEDPARSPATLRILAGSMLLLLDLPPLRVEDNDGGIYVAAVRTNEGNTWGGASIYRGLPGTALNALASVASEPVCGTLLLPLAAGVHTVFDDFSTLTVQLSRGQFESRSDADLLEEGANTLAVGAHGRWELLQFGDAQQTGPTTWVLSHLLRGRRGSDHNIGLSQAGDVAVLVSGAGIVRLPLPASDVGTELIYRAVTIGATLASGVDQPFTSTGEAITPFSPVHVSASGVGDLLIEWMRRDRLAIEFEPGPLPLSETTEAYIVEILDDASPPNVVRTIASSTPSAVYTAAQQSDDFGSPVPSPLHVKIYQIGQLGRGHAREAFL